MLEGGDDPAEGMQVGRFAKTFSLCPTWRHSTHKHLAVMPRAIQNARFKQPEYVWEEGDEREGEYTCVNVQIKSAFYCALLLFFSSFRFFFVCPLGSCASDNGTYSTTDNDERMPVGGAPQTTWGRAVYDTV